MIFNSVKFFVFFITVLLIFFLIPKKARLYWLLAASYFFYMSWNPKYALLILFSTLATFTGAVFIDRSEGNIKKRKAVLGSVIFVNLLILGIFKYLGFLTDTVNSFLKFFGLSASLGKLNILLPVGISFYVFQALGYIIDVYRGDIKAEKNIFRYALFVSFFPQLVAGPIERSGNLLSQIRELPEKKLFDLKRMTSGVILMIYGFFLKMVIADRAALLVNPVFENCRGYGAVELIIAAVSFSIQIYCDFAGYSFIACGSAKIMGFSLMENFKAPYLAVSIQDFWRRWHISLSTWFRDYLYIPLGGNREGKFKKYRNLMITFLVSGLWHGAAWTFVIWGGLHGLMQVAGGITKKFRETVTKKMGADTSCFSFRFLRVMITFILTCAAWVFFRASSAGDAFYFFRQIFLRPDIWNLTNGGMLELGLERFELNIFIIALFVLFAFDIIREKLDLTIDKWLMKQNLWFRWAVMIGLILFIFVFGEYGSTFDPQQFMYFQF